jgi:DNA-binding response OmpR family regulator
VTGGWGEAGVRWSSSGVDTTPPDDRRCVLVVEDDDLTRGFLLENLSADGFPAVGAGGVAEGLRAIEVRQPALVVLDLGLQDGNGLVLLDRLAGRRWACLAD